jgi:hypothetical protein
MFSFDSPPPTNRTYHWSPANQRRFVACLAETGSVQQASGAVAMARESAYRFRRRAGALAFRIGWDAAVLIAQEMHEDTVMRYAFAPVEEVGVRHPETRRLRWRRVDPALGRGRGLALLYRLDRSSAALAKRGRDHALARVAVQHFEQFLAVIERGATSAEVTAFLVRRGGSMLRPFICDLSRNSGLSESRQIDPVGQFSGAFQPCEARG